MTDNHDVFVSSGQERYLIVLFNDSQKSSGFCGEADSPLSEGLPRGCHILLEKLDYKTATGIRPGLFWTVFFGRLAW